MKILMVSIFAPHFFNWTEQLKESGHEIYWIDILDSNTQVKKIDFVEQIIGWRYKWDHPGRYFIKKNFPLLTGFINLLNERDFQAQFEKQLKRIQPDVVHSFVMQSAGIPVLEIMNRNPEIKWIYSSWGSDVYYYNKSQSDREAMKKVLSNIDYLFTDCLRDFKIATNLNFNGKFLGKFPGRGGYDFYKSDRFIKPFKKRTTILIKGYQGKHGRCIPVLKAILRLKVKLKSYKIIVFGADMEVVKFVENSEMKNWDNLIVLRKIDELEVLKLMGDSILYIGNSLSDGMPNTLLEAIISGAFPIQSNPGGATAELIEDGKNGLIINNPEDAEEIFKLILIALNDPKKTESGIDYNFQFIKPNLERNFVQKQVLEKYELISISLAK